MQQKPDYHPQDIRNLVLFIVCSVLLWLAYDHFVLMPQKEALKAAQEKQQQFIQNNPQLIAAQKERPREEVIAATGRVLFDNGSVYGSINLTGARLDDMHLHEYHTTAERTQDALILSPAGGPYPRYMEYGWVANGNARVPDKDTRWSVRGNDTLSPGNPVTLEWNNGQGLTFTQTYALDDAFGFTVTQNVENNSGQSVTLYPYGLVTEHGLPEDYSGRWIIHEGPIGYIGGELIEHDYDHVEEQQSEIHTAATGWIGLTEKYWLTALVPDQQEAIQYRFIHTPPSVPGGKDLYQADVTGQARAIAPGESASFTLNSFAGAKKVATLVDYEKEWGVNHFDLAVDFGLFYFLTRPFFFVINFFYGLVGNFGVAIIMFTVLLRIAVFPLANTSFKSFAKLRQVTPQMYELRDKYKDDKQKLQEEMVKLYQREQVNPMAGCLPILVQIPIFFALFKVLSNTIEMRHAPFFGWIDDLSAPDPTTVFNLFGLIPWEPPQMLMIGAWPCLMLITMIVQRKLSPPPQDKTQAMIIAAMPWVMTFVLAQFAAGLVIYWTFNNLLSSLQQYIIMRRMGVEVHLFKKDPLEEKMEQAIEDGPTIHPEAAMIEHDIEEALGNDDESKPVTKPKPKKKKKK